MAPAQVGLGARWQARTDIVKRGFYPNYARIWAGVEPTPEEREKIAHSCRVNQDNMLRWSADPNAKLPRIYAGHIYFITDGEAVKIGFSQDVIRRMGNMQTENARDLKLLTSIQGSIDDEIAIQRRFRHLHIRGDWFRLEGDLIEFIGTLPAGYTVCKRHSRRQRRDITRA